MESIWSGSSQTRSARHTMRNLMQFGNVGGWQTARGS